MTDKTLVCRDCGSEFVQKEKYNCKERYNE